MDTPSPSLEPWVLAAAQLPVAFAQVREDPAVDRWVIEQCAGQRQLDVIQIASGGCTAAVVAAMPQVRHLHIVDPNPAQIALTRLKCHLLTTHPPSRRLELLGHHPMAPTDRATQLRQAFSELNLESQCLGDFDLVANSGPDQVGRYEYLFATLRKELTPWQAHISKLLQARAILGQIQFLQDNPGFQTAINEAFQRCFSLDNLIHLFGTAATGNAVMPFADHFIQRVHVAFTTLLTARNPYLWSLLVGGYPDNDPIDWLRLPTLKKLADLRWTKADMVSALTLVPDAYDVVHLSNILDWLSPDAATHTLNQAWQALRPGGYVIIRQLNSSLPIRTLGSPFQWLQAESTRLHAQDRSFFYRDLHVGRKA